MVPEPPPPRGRAGTATQSPTPKTGGSESPAARGGGGREPRKSTADPRAWSRKSVLTILLAAIALSLGGGVFAALASLKEEPPRRGVPLRTFNVTVYEVLPTDFREIVAGFGTARADRSVDISAEVSGLVIETHPDLEIGTRVAGPEPTLSEDGRRSTRPAGELLLKLDPGTFEQQVVRLRGQIQGLQKQIEQVRAEEANDRRLIETQQRNLQSAQEELESKERSRRAGAGSSTAVRQAEQAVNQFQETLVRTRNQLSLTEVREAQLQAQVASAEAELAASELDVDRTEIRPPFTGVLSMVNVEPGQFVRAGDPLVSLTDLDHIEIPVSLTHTQFARVEPLLKAGQTPVVSLAVNETDDPVWTGRLVRASPIADETTRTVDVFVEVDNAAQPSPLLPGTFVHARIEGPVIEQAVVVPRDAIVRGEVYLASEDVMEAVRRRSALLRSEEPDDAALQEQLAALGDDVNAKLKSARKVRVDIDRTLQTFAFVGNGVAPGDRIVMTNLDIIFDDALLVVQESVTPADEVARQRVIALQPVP